MIGSAPTLLPTTPSPKQGNGRTKRWRIVLIILAVLVLFRIALPYVLLHIANDRLANMPGYNGHIEDLDLALIRGAYSIEHFHLDIQDSTTQKLTPFLRAGLIDLSVEWRALLEGSIVGELVIDSAEVSFTMKATDPEKLQKDTADFRQLLHDFMPLKINRVKATHSAFRFVDPTSSPKLDLQLDQLELLATNLTNSSDSTKLLPSTVEATAQLYGGHLRFDMDLDPLAEQPAFDMNMELTETELVRLNELLQAYANVDVNKGTLGLYAEMATRNGAFDGYVKPLIKDLDVLGREDKKDPLFRKVWEGIAGTVADVVSNQPKDQLATKVQMKGRLDKVDIGAWGAVLQTLRNAFIQALMPSIDKEVNIRTVKSANEEKKGFLGRLFDGKKEEK